MAKTKKIKSWKRAASCYVSITRQKILYLHWVLRSRYFYGEKKYNEPTCFLRRNHSSNLLDYQGLARPANSSFPGSAIPARYQQIRSGHGRPRLYKSGSVRRHLQVHFYRQSALERAIRTNASKPEVDWAIGDIAHHTRNGTMEQFWRSRRP